MGFKIDFHCSALISFFFFVNCVSSLLNQFSCWIWFQLLSLETLVPDSWFLAPVSSLPSSLELLPPATKQFPQLPKLSGRPPNSLCAPVGFPVDQSKRLPPISANQRAGGDGTGQSETGMPLTNSNCCYLAQIGLVLAVNGCFHIHTGICLIAAPSHYQPRGGPRLFMAGSKENFSDGQF